jgi:hypothetical protein
LIPKVEGEHVYRTIVDYLMESVDPEKNIDFVACGNQGADFSMKGESGYIG